ncbi:AraC family transcriptional regulator, partial [Staphylococcus sp. SIMBA_130]
MYKLLIADRDKQELLGIQWLISKYSFPITSIKLAEQVAEVINELENEIPDILCIELDMVPEDRWEMVK